MHKLDKKIPLMVEPLKAGALLNKEGFIGMNDVQTALSLQKKERTQGELGRNRLIGMILCDLNLVTPVDTYFVLHKYNKLRTLESALLAANIVSEKELKASCVIARQKRVPLISHLLKTGQVSSAQMQTLLYDLYHVPFRSIRDVQLNRQDRSDLIKVIDRQKASQKQVVPLMLKDNTILFGITSPENMLFIHELNHQFPQYRFKVVFVPQWGVSRFSRVVYGQTPSVHAARSEKPLDLSLMLQFRTTIQHPVNQRPAIQKLYHCYEQLQHLSGQKRKENRQVDFFRFIQMSHQSITKEYQCSRIEFSLKKADDGVKLIAQPKPQEG